jgi:D-aspartate ligase
LFRFDLMQRSRYPSALLTRPKYGGTLAAVRQLARSGVPVIIVGHEILAAARWSRYASRFISCPPVQDGDRFVKWLLAYGEQQPGNVLLPTSDEIVLLLSANLESLEKHFFLYQPQLESVLKVLDKKLLWQACRRAGIDTLPSWFPSGEEDVSLLIRSFPYPVLIKPRTQVRRFRRTQGVVVHSPEELLSAYRAVASQSQNSAGYGALSGADFPMVQQFTDSDAIYSVSGFIDRTGETMVARGTKKIFQRRRPVGIGVCFEACQLDNELAERVRALCREVGHFGVFEIEFLRWQQKWVAIDFNPRFYHQMALEIGRGLALPRWAYLGACGEDSLLKIELQRAANSTVGDKSVFCDRFTFRAIRTAMRITGRLNRTDASGWKRWLQEHRGAIVDIAFDVGDPIPAVVHALSELTSGLQAVPRFLSEPSKISRPAL